MKTLFTSPDPLQVRALTAFLEANGFAVVVQGEDRVSVAGGLAPIDCWPEVRLMRAEQEEQARACVSLFLAESATDLPLEPWSCPTCGEVLEGQFSECWRCQKHESTHYQAGAGDSGRLKQLFYYVIAAQILLWFIAPVLPATSLAGVPFQLQDIVSGTLSVDSTAGRTLEVAAVLLQLGEWAALFLLLPFARYLLIILFFWKLVCTAVTLRYALYAGPGLAASLLDLSLQAALVALVFVSPLSLLFQDRKVRLNENGRSSPAGR